MAGIIYRKKVRGGKVYVLNKKLRHHLKVDANVTTRKGLEDTIWWQFEHGIRCWDCREAARKLGLEVPEFKSIHNIEEV